MRLRAGGATKVRKPRKLDRREAYRQAAELVSGELQEGKRRSGDRVLVKRGPWSIWLDTYTVHTGQASVTYTRVRADFVGWRELRVKVRRRNWLDRLLEKVGFGGRPLPVDRRLLEHWVVTGQPDRRVPSLFSAPELTEAVLALPRCHVYVKRGSRKSRKRFGEDAGEVVAQVEGVVTDVPRLGAMIRVVGEALEALERVGEARREAPPDS